MLLIDLTTRPDYLSPAAACHNLACSCDPTLPNRNARAYLRSLINWKQKLLTDFRDPTIFMQNKILTLVQLVPTRASGSLASLSVIQTSICNTGTNTSHVLSARRTRVRVASWGVALVGNLSRLIHAGCGSSFAWLQCWTPVCCAPSAFVRSLS
jgi:hypothetical protein